MSVVVRYWAAAKQAAGRAEERVDGATTLAEVLDAVRARHAPRPALARVLERCAYLVDGAPVGTRPPTGVPVGPASVVEVLPPFAGG